MAWRGGVRRSHVRAFCGWISFGMVMVVDGLQVFFLNDMFVCLFLEGFFWTNGTKTRLIPKLRFSTSPRVALTCKYRSFDFRLHLCCPELVGKPTCWLLVEFRLMNQEIVSLKCRLPKLCEQSVEKYFWNVIRKHNSIGFYGPWLLNCLLVVVPTWNLTRGTGIRSSRQWFTLAMSLVPCLKFNMEPGNDGFQIGIYILFQGSISGSMWILGVVLYIRSCFFGEKWKAILLKAHLQPTMQGDVPFEPGAGHLTGLLKIS